MGKNIRCVHRQGRASVRDMDREQRLQNSRRVQDPYSRSPRQCVLLGFSRWHFVTRQNGTTCILGYRSGRPIDREKHTRSKTDMLYGRCGEFLEFCCAISCCMRHICMLNCTNSGLGMPVAFTGGGVDCVPSCSVRAGGDDGAGGGIVSLKDTCALVAPPS